ncbi:MAG: AbrB family transcriptional regulator, partial [Rhodobacteraceae bacterium]|nr:AbrB family transcriptional regulator [Paracoccaceae bacterium]
LILCPIVGWRGAKAIGMFSAFVLGPMIVASIASLLGYLTTRPPAEAIWAAQYFIALSVGLK